MTQTLRGEMRRVGQCLQAGIMAPPRAGANEQRGSVDCVGPAGEEKLIRGTYWARSVEVMEKVMVTQRGKLNGVTETCTRHIETREIREEVTELAETRRGMQELKEIPETREMGTVEERLHGKDGVGEVKGTEHTHTEVVEDNGGEMAERVGTRCGQLGGLLRERGEVVCPLEGIHDQVGSVVPSGVEGVSAANGCT